MQFGILFFGLEQAAGRGGTWGLEGSAAVVAWACGTRRSGGMGLASMALVFNEWCGGLGVIIWELCGPL